MEQMRSRIARDEVNVEVDSGPGGPELGAVLSGLRSQYEGIVKANKEQAEQWYHKKVGREVGDGVPLKGANGARRCCRLSWRRCRTR